jgi:hypothetical protein
MSKKINMMDHFDHGKSSNEKAAWWNFCLECVFALHGQEVEVMIERVQTNKRERDKTNQ